MTETEQNLEDAIVKDPSRFINDPEFRRNIPQVVQDAVTARLRTSRVPAKIFNAFRDAK